MSLYVAAIFFVPLILLVLVPTLFATRRLRTWAKVLTGLWLFSCLYAEFMMLMGFAFNSSNKAVLITMVIWPFIGLAMIWGPLGLKMLVYREGK